MKRTHRTAPCDYFAGEGNASLDVESAFRKPPSWLIRLSARLLFDFLWTFSSFFPVSVEAKDLMEMVSVSATGATGSGISMVAGSSVTGIEMPASPPPPTSRIVVSGLASSSLSGRPVGSVLFCVGVSRISRGPSAKRSGNEDDDGIGATSSCGSDGDKASADALPSDVSRRIGDLPVLVFRVAVTRPISSLSRRRADSISSSNCTESVGEVLGAMSEAVGRDTGMGTGAFVTEIVGRGARELVEAYRESG